MFWHLFLTVSVLFLHGLCCNEDSAAIHSHLSIASFNIQNFGDKKFCKKDVVNVIKKIITRYDLICLQEIVAQKRAFLYNLLNDINRISSKGQYAMVISASLGRNSTSKENYVYFYRTNRLTVAEVQVYPDPNKLFFRPPYIAYLHSPTTRSLSSFIAICVHIKPNKSANETSALADVYDYAKKLYRNENSVIMGDMNAACKNLRVSEWSNISLWTRPEFFWLINNSVDTSTYTSSCAHDRIIITGDEMKQDTIYNSVKALDFQAEFNVTEQLTRQVSDHFPVEFQLRGKVPSVFVDNILTDICISVYDKRPSKRLFQMIDNNNIRRLNFNVYKDFNGSRARLTTIKRTTNVQDLLSSLEDFNKKSNYVLSPETIETIRFKVKHGSLVDSGSYSSIVNAKYTLNIDCNLITGFCVVYICKQTFFN
ncbi:deoxyribonuclease-1-like isoform X2 [Centruroides sculpturatus]|uniref:deoxyribonuclease-1-like isoform X2 n=1 Tax=Centruroides sculpturatus TaxID=218467 RepID=UPI000C6EFD51|nr:deoxyribonuclease-1-like isoform X2 [Centruroides sculpturatus]